MAEQEAENSGGGSKRLIVGGIVALMVLGNVGFLGYTMMGDDEGEKASTEDGEPGEEGEEKEGDNPPGTLGPMVTLEPFVVNLSDVTEIHYLRVQLSIELRDEAAGKEFETKKIPVRDRVIFYLSGLTMDELRTPSDKDVVRQRLLEIIRDASGNRGVRHIYFNEFMVQ